MRISFKQMWSEFKAFAFKGNMIELAVAVVIGAAFGRVITSLVEDVIMPTAQYSIHAAKEGAKVVQETTRKATASITSQPTATQTTTESSTKPAVVVAVAPPVPTTPPKDDKAIEIEWKIGPINIGKFIGSLINFVIVAFAVFITMVKVVGSVMKRVGGTPAASEPTTKECPKCLSVIPLKATKCAHCTADI